MGQMNAVGHLLCAVAGGQDELWQLGDELAARFAKHVIAEHGADRAAEQFGIRDDDPAMTVHSLDPARADGNRWCVHPASLVQVEFRDPSLTPALERAVTWLAQQLPEDELWRRD